MSETIVQKCDLQHDQRGVIKFYCLRKKSATKTYVKMKVVHGNECVIRHTMFS